MCTVQRPSLVAKTGKFFVYEEKKFGRIGSRDYYSVEEFVAVGTHAESCLKHGESEDILVILSSRVIVSASGLNDLCAMF